MLTAHGTVTIRPKEVIPIYREEWNATVTDYKYDFVNRDFVSRGGNLYQVKIQRPGQFVPAGIDPASVEGQEYWQMFNKLAPSVTNFLVIIDEDGKPQTLMSGGRIQTKFLNIGSLNMSETRLWGGAELFTGKGLALVNDPDDRKFVVYNDANNYVEMFQREDEWGLKGRVAGKDIFQLGNINKIGPFSVYNEHLYFQNKQMSDDLWMSMQLGAAGDNNNGFDLYVSWIEQSPLLPIGERTAMHVKLSTSRNGQAILAESRGYKDNTRNYAIRAIGNCRVEDGVLSIENGYIKGTIVPATTLDSSSTSNIELDLQETLVYWHGSSKINISLPSGAPGGHTVIFHAGAGRKADLGIICSTDARLNYRGTTYNWINVSNRNLTIIVRKIGGYWFATHEEEWTSGFGN